MQIHQLILKNNAANLPKCAKLLRNPQNKNAANPYILNNALLANDGNDSQINIHANNILLANDDILINTDNNILTNADDNVLINIILAKGATNTNPQVSNPLNATYNIDQMSTSTNTNNNMLNSAIAIILMQLIK